MKKLLCFLTMATGVALAQAAPFASAPTSHSAKIVETSNFQLYCSGFISHQTFPRSQYITGGDFAPHSSRFGVGDQVFLAGTGYEVGQRYAILREVRDPNGQMMFGKQSKLLKQAGHLYDEIGWLQVRNVEKDSAVGVIEFSCDAAVPGDFLTAYQKKTPLQLRPAQEFHAYGVPRGQATGQILMGKEFDGILGTDHIAYVDIGANKGLKPGDYLRITRSGRRDEMSPIDALSLGATMKEDTQVKPAKTSYKDLDRVPRRGLGQAIVLSVTEESATILITRALEDIQLGDGVETEN